jgi:uncharacterized protein DUF6188
VERLDFSFLVGQPVEQVWVWGPVRLVFSSADPEVYIDLHEPRLIAADSTTVIDFVQHPDEAAAVLSLLWKKAVGAESQGGTLRVSFENGVVLEEDPDDQHESWSVVGEGQVFQCMRGGEVLRL